MRRTHGIKTLTALLSLVLFFGLIPWLDAQSRPQPRQSLYYIQAQAAQNGWTTDLHVQAGDLYERMGDYQAMIAHWEAADTLDVTHLERLARTYMQLGRWTPAYDTFTRLLIRVPTSTTAYYYLGAILAARDPLRAQPALEQAAQDATYTDIATALLNVLSGDLRDPGFALRVGQTFMQHGQPALAEYAFEHAAFFNGQAVAYAHLAIVRQMQDENGDEWMRTALIRGEHNATIAYLNGLYLRREDDFEASLQEFSRAVLLDPDNPALYAEMGKAHELLFQFESAEHWLQQAIDISENDPQFIALLADLYIDYGFNDLKSLQSMRETLPEDASIIAGIGWQLYNNGDQEAGIADIDRALSLEPQNPDAIYYKARTLLNVGQADAARPYLQTLTEATNTHTEWAEDMLQILPEPLASP